MVAQQRTFDLIPTTLARPADQPRRMTSKQVKKAYQKKNKGPKISRAEQRRLDAEELAKQKVEYERERASAKAKAVREKKAAKELAEKAERKRKGLPEPSRFVRASQPTISMFVQKGNNKRTWEEMANVKEEAEESDGTVCDQEEVCGVSKESAVEEESEDEFGDFPSLSQANVPELLALSENGSTLVTVKDNKLEPDEDPQAIDELEESVNDSDQEQLPPPPRQDIEDDEYFDEDDELLSDMVTIQLLSEAADAAHRSDGLNYSSPRLFTEAMVDSTGNLEDSHCRINPHSKHAMVVKLIPEGSPVDVMAKAHIPEDQGEAADKIYPINVSPYVISRSALQDQSVNMPPPPFKGLKAVASAATPSRLKDSAKKLLQPTQLPSATQAFLENHLEDFFPSPSQAFRELLEDIDDIPSNTQVAKELDDEELIEEDLTVENPTAEDPVDEEINHSELFMSTQEFNLSPQDLLDFDTPSRPPTNSTFACGGSPPLLLHKATDNLPTSSTLTRSLPPEFPAEKAVTRPRRRFFEEKDDDLLYAALYESKIQVVHKQPGAGATREAPIRHHRTLQRIQSTTTDYGDEEFNDLEMKELIKMC